MRISDLSSDVCSSDLRLHLEDESGNGGVARLHDARGRGLLARRRRELGKRVDELLDAEILQRRSEKDGRQSAVPIGGGVERGIARHCQLRLVAGMRSEEHTSELQSLMSMSFAGFCLIKKNIKKNSN